MYGIPMIRYNVNCLAGSSSGAYLATGEKGQLGVRARTILWNTQTWTQVQKIIHEPLDIKVKKMNALWICLIFATFL